MAPRRRRLRLGVIPAGAALVAVLGGALWSKLGPAPTRAEVRSLAVLPMESLSDRSEDDYFADGITEALNTELAGIRSLRVISRQSAMRYKDSNKSLPEIALAAILVGDSRESPRRVSGSP